MPSEMKLIQYTHQYQNQIIDLILHIQQEEFQVPITKSDQPDLMNIEHFYQTGNGNFWMALHKDVVVGTISLLDIGNQQVALRKMFVDKNYRGPQYQVAYQLLQTALSWAKEHSVSDIYLGTTPQFLAAHRFYEKNGFVQITKDELPERFPVLAVDKRFYRYHLKDDFQ
ncbi:GNAT family N-acetyltransferase [Bacillus timonensis]|nr:GNAT family N-acetyltransferase [Bacillus timonensis]